MRRCAALLTMIVLTVLGSQGLAGCGEPAPPAYVAIDTLCTRTTRFHATDGQRAAFKADRPLWESLVDWLASFNAVRDKACLQPSPY
jgi:hypothetical protein